MNFEIVLKCLSKTEFKKRKSDNLEPKQRSYSIGIFDDEFDDEKEEQEKRTRKMELKLKKTRSKAQTNS